MLVAPLTVHLALLVVFDPAIALGHVGCRDLGQAVLGAPCRSQLLVVRLNSLQSVDLFLDRGQRGRLSLTLADVDQDGLLHVKTLASCLRIAHLVRHA